MIILKRSKIQQLVVESGSPELDWSNSDPALLVKECAQLVSSDCQLPCTNSIPLSGHTVSAYFTRSVCEFDEILHLKEFTHCKFILICL